MRTQMKGLPALVLLAFASSAVAQVRINEIFPDPGSEFDGAEFIELYNAGGSPVNIGGWVLTGTEFAGTCGGEDHWQFPAGATIPAGGFIVLAKDVKDTLTVDVVSFEGDDGFERAFGSLPDFEMVDLSFGHDTDDPRVPNLTLLTPATQNDQIGLIPGDGYARACASNNQYEALYLYNGVPGSGGVVQDVIEYRDPVNCIADACLGVGTGDNDAFQGLPAVGQTLGRDATSSDTGNSSVDLHLGTPTPKAVNIPNPGPTLSNFTINNPDPLVGQSVTITIDAVDANGIGSLYLVKSVNGGAPDSVLMTNTSGSTYSGTIPAQADQAHVEVFVRARDAGVPVGRSKFPDHAARRIRWGTQTIFQTQFHSPPSDGGRSAEVGKAVNVQGVVTVESGPYDTAGNVIFAVQSGAGFWNGVYVFDDVGTTSVARGDSVRIAGVVTEYFGRTEIHVLGGENVTKIASGRPLPGPFVATCSQLTTGSSFGELLEGVYSRIVNVRVTNTFTFGEWEATDATGPCRVGHDAFYLYAATIGDSIDVVEGIVDYSFSNRKLEPRDDLDVQGPPLVSNVRYSPIPPVSTSPITISATLTDNGTLVRTKLYFSTNNGASYDSTNLVLVSGTTYAATVGPYGNGTDLDYHVEITDDDGFRGRAPSTGNYDLYVGMVTIQTIQSTVKAGTDSSSFESQPRNVAGIVTQAPGTITDNTFVIQNHWTTDPAFRGIHVYSGGSLVGQLELGDSVAVCGDVDEYFGLTEMRMHFTDAYHDYGQVGELQGYVLPTSGFLPDSTGAMPAAESWEGVLLQFNGSTVTNANAGFGQYYIDNTAPSTGQETLVDDEARVSGLTYVPVPNDTKTYRGIGDFTYGQYKLQPRDNSDILPFNPDDAVGVAVAGAELKFALHQNAPNPAGLPGTRITFSLPRGEQTTLRLFDVQGRLVRTLVKGHLDAGAHTIAWDGQNDQGQAVSTGVYFYRLSAGKDSATRKLTYLR